MKTYFIIGSPKSGRRGVILDVINKMMSEDNFCGVFISTKEENSESDKAIATASNAGIIRYDDVDDAIEKLANLDKDKFDYIFYLSNSYENLADEMEAIKKIYDTEIIDLAGIWGLIDCAMMLNFEKETFNYIDAISHFSDSILLSRREDLSGKQLSEIKSKFDKLCRPHYIELVDKKFRIKNPEIIMIDQARRISMLFDDVDPIDDIDFDEDNLPEEPFELIHKEDPFLERIVSGARAKQICDITKYALETHQA